MATASRFSKNCFDSESRIGRGYYAMAGRDSIRIYIYSWPTGRWELWRDSAVQATFGSQLEEAKKNGESPDQTLSAEMEKCVRPTIPNSTLDTTAARGFVDAIITPEKHP
jgi:acetyl-CoA carboxylase carboxyltransferase component